MQQLHTCQPLFPWLFPGFLINLEQILQLSPLVFLRLLFCFPSLECGIMCQKMKMHVCARSRDCICICICVRTCISRYICICGGQAFAFRAKKETSFPTAAASWSGKFGLIPICPRPARKSFSPICAVCQLIWPLWIMCASIKYVTLAHSRQPT